MIHLDKDLTNRQIIDILIAGGTVSIRDNERKKQIQKALRNIKKNCTIVLSQLKE